MNFTKTITNNDDDEVKIMSRVSHNTNYTLNHLSSVVYFLRQFLFKNSPLFEFKIMLNIIMLE